MLISGICSAQPKCTASYGSYMYGLGSNLWCQCFQPTDFIYITTATATSAQCLQSCVHDN